MSYGEVNRREFLAAAGGVAAASMIGDITWAAEPRRRRRYALVGTGMRGTTTWGRDLADRYADVVDFAGLCDVNPLRVEVARRRMGLSCPTFTNLDTMLTAVKPDVLIVTTIDANHAECIIQALDRNIDVITEKPMVIDAAQCRAVLAAEARATRPIVVAFNYRYEPRHQKIKEVLLSGDIH